MKRPLNALIPLFAISLMTKRLLIITVLVAITYPIQAKFGLLKQSPHAIEFTAGPSLVSLYSENISRDKGIRRQQKIGYTARVTLFYPLTLNTSFKPGILFERKGLKNKI